MKIDRFVLAIGLVVLLAWLFPQAGSRHSALPLDLVASIGVSLIFFFYGLKLSPDKIKNGLKNWRLHVLVQLSTFVLFPLLVLPFYFAAQGPQAQATWLSFMFLAALPSTVSSSVVMVSMAGGNVPAAIFNASISGLIGIAVTPLWMGLFIGHNTGSFALDDVYLGLLTEIVAPVLLGLVLQQYWGRYAVKYSRSLSLFDRAVILLIVYKSFSASFEEKVFSAIDTANLLCVAGMVLVLFYAVYYLTGLLSKKLGFDRADRITAQFCGTKKSLVHGTVFAKILFPASLPAGLMLLPLMLFHALQILLISVMAGKMARQTNH